MQGRDTDADQSCRASQAAHGLASDNGGNKQQKIEPGHWPVATYQGVEQMIAGAPAIEQHGRQSQQGDGDALLAPSAPGWCGYRIGPAPGGMREGSQPNQVEYPVLERRSVLPTEARAQRQQPVRNKQA